MEVLEAIHRRRAVRGYTADDVDDEAIGALIEAAIQAPSGMNRQPWLFVVVKDRALLHLWSDRAKDDLRSMVQASSVGPVQERLDTLHSSIFHEAPVLIVICATQPDPMAAHDCCLAAQNLMLAACDRGLGTCWIGLAQPWLATADGQAALGIDPHITPIAPVIVGVPRGAPEAPPRRPADVRWIRPAPP
jgi:nitroreductase